MHSNRVPAILVPFSRASRTRPRGTQMTMIATQLENPPSFQSNVLWLTE